MVIEFITEQYLNDLRPNLRAYDTTLRFQSEKKSSGKILAEPTKLPLPKKVDWYVSYFVTCFSDFLLLSSEKECKLF